MYHTTHPTYHTFQGILCTAKLTEIDRTDKIPDASQHRRQPPATLTLAFPSISLLNSLVLGSHSQRMNAETSAPKLDEGVAPNNRFKPRNGIMSYRTARRCQLYKQFNHVFLRKNCIKTDVRSCWRGKPLCYHWVFFCIAPGDWPHCLATPPLMATFTLCCTCSLS